MNPEIKERWIKALESGKYKFGKQKLRDRNSNCFCAGGVLCDLHSEETEGSWFYNPVDYIYYGNRFSAPDTVLEWAGLSRSDMKSIEVKNDINMDYSQVIKFIKEKL